MPIETIWLFYFPALQAEADSETMTSIHSCPLCGDSFDNRTGQSNHIRGHLKKIGKGYASKNKSPLLYLRELMRDKKELQRALHILGKRRNRFHYDFSPKFPSAECLTSLPLENDKSSSIPSICTDSRPLMPVFSLADMDSEKDQQETKLDIKNSFSGTTALIGILKKRKCPEDTRLKPSSQISKNIAVSLNTEYSSGSRVASSLPKSTSGEWFLNAFILLWLHLDWTIVLLTVWPNRYCSIAVRNTCLYV